MLDLKSLVIGLILAIMLYFMFLFNKLFSLGILGFFIGAAIGGYVVGGNLKIGAIHGAIISFFGSIIAIFSYDALISYYSNTPMNLGINLISLIAVAFIYAVIGAVFGSIGALVKTKIMEKE